MRIYVRIRNTVKFTKRHVKYIQRNHCIVLPSIHVHYEFPKVSFLDSKGPYFGAYLPITLMEELNQKTKIGVKEEEVLVGTYFIGIIPRVAEPEP